MKEAGKIYCDVSKYYITPTSKDEVYDMVVNKHYAGRWTGASLILGVYEKGKSQHQFFSMISDRLVGCIVYGSPVARHGVKSISESLNFDEVYELKRLWIEDGHGSNTESPKCISSVGCPPDLLSPKYIVSAVGSTTISLIPVHSISSSKIRTGLSRLFSRMSIVALFKHVG